MVRPASAADLLAILHLLRRCPEAAQWTAGQIERALQHDLVLVAAGPTHTAGFVVARRLGPEWEIDNLAVEPESRRKRIARELLIELLSLAQVQNVEAIFLEVRASNQGARTFYESLGFRECGRRKDYYRCPKEDAVRYKMHPFSAPKSG
jgi:ribosomal-protein-alanine N-acetyltransferase